MPRDGESHEQWLERMGIGDRQNKHHVYKATTRTRGVIADEGPLAGRRVGTQTDHWSDRLDAKVQGMTVHVNTAALHARKEQHNE